MCLVCFYIYKIQRTNSFDQTATIKQNIAYAGYVCKASRLIKVTDFYGLNYYFIRRPRVLVAKPIKTLEIINCLLYPQLKCKAINAKGVVCTLKMPRFRITAVSKNT